MSMDMEIDIKQLSKDARETLRIIDLYLDHMGDNIAVLSVYETHWDTLETSIKYNHREEEYSLRTHTYRGVKLVSEEKHYG
jgi:outer membrane lipopolysaccharide assembly protein LptE/RlpB